MKFDEKQVFLLNPAKAPIVNSDFFKWLKANYDVRSRKLRTDADSDVSQDRKVFAAYLGKFAYEAGKAQLSGKLLSLLRITFEHFQRVAPVLGYISDLSEVFLQSAKVSGFCMNQNTLRPEALKKVKELDIFWVDGGAYLKVVGSNIYLCAGQILASRVLWSIENGKD